MEQINTLNMYLYKIIEQIIKFSHGMHRRFWQFYTINYLRSKGISCKNCRFNGKIYFKIKSPHVYIGENFYLNSGPSYCINSSDFSKIIVSSNGILKIGNNTGISSSVISCYNRIEIGNGVNIGSGSLILDTNFHSTDSKLRSSRKENLNDISTKPIIINDNVFIGAHSIILKGVTIGKNSIIAAGSVVAKSIPENEIWGGNPAKFIKKIE